jgi:ubiquinone biosynthesis protein UbiJ
MSTRDLALAGIEQAINTLIGLDPAAADRLARLHGRVIAVRLTGVGLEFIFVPGPDGQLQLLGSIEGEPDCRLSGSPLDLMRSGDKQEGPAQLFAGRVSIDGDVELAQAFGDIVGDLDIDWEEQLSGITGDVLAHQVGSGARRARRWVAELTGTTLPSNLREFLQEEVRLLPTRWEADEFADAVDQVRDTAERLAARLKRLREHLSEGDRNRA